MTISITNRLSTAVGRLLGDSAEAAGVRPWGWHGLPRRRPLNRTQIVVGSGPFHPVDLERAQGWPRCQFLCSLWRADSKPCLWGHRFRSDQLRHCSAQLSKENITKLEKLNPVHTNSIVCEKIVYATVVKLYQLDFTRNTERHASANCFHLVDFRFRWYQFSRANALQFFSWNRGGLSQFKTISMRTSVATNSVACSAQLLKRKFVKWK